MKRRAYNTLGRRFLSVLAEGGPRKYNVLRGLAFARGHIEQRFKQTLERLRAAGLIVFRNRQGGIHIALPKKR